MYSLQDFAHLLCVAALATAGYLTYLVLFRLYLSPLARFPGPKLAAATAWYEFYHDALRHGKYTFEIARMHEQYGPIVRISPWELHIDDPEYYEVLYSYNQPRDKYKLYANMFGTPEAIIAVLDHAHHRSLRANMNPYFSMQRIRSLEPEIQVLVDKLCYRLNDFKNKGVPITLQHAYTCFSTDVISDYAMGTGFHYLDAPDFVPEWSNTLSGIAQGSVWFKPLPWLLTLLKSLPHGLVKKLNPGMDLMFAFQDRCGVLINLVIESEKTGEKFKNRTFFHDVLASDLPQEEKTAERLAQQIQTVIGAGSETVAKTLSWMTFHLLDNPEKLEKLKEELNRLDPDRKAKLADFEKMPYLVSSGPLSPSPR